MKNQLFMQLRGILLALSVALPLAACGEKHGQAKRPGIDPTPERQAETAIDASFVVEQKQDGDQAERVRIAIKRAALGKEFLLQSGLTLMPYLGTSNGNLSRIVVFKEIDGGLWMFEATDGHIVTADIPQTFVLAKFPIIRQNSDVIVFDFNAGMSDLLIGEEWRASDFTGNQPQKDNFALKTRLSYLEAASITADNELVIRQIAQVDMPSAAGAYMDLIYNQDHATIEMKYYLTPYAPNPNFVPKVSPGFNNVGFFEVAPRYDAAGNAVVHATKFADGDITFALSANIPADFKQAVADGVLYWNKILGGRVKVTEAPAGVNAPDFNHNVVQWINWDSAGFAYADAQMDPRTGETLHAQVYMTSVFAVGGLESAQQWLDRLGIPGPVVDDTADDAAGLKRRVGLAGFTNGHLCHYDATPQFKRLMQRAVADELADGAVLKIAQDYVREVVAHEIGHTLGLRHNFAGSLSANFPVSELDAVFTQYVTDGRAPADKVATSSVMEYETFLNSAISGDQLVTREAAFSYDQLAIGNLYLGQDVDPSTAPLYCTDSHVGLYVDCQVFDDGPSIPASVARSVVGSQRALSEFGEILYFLEPELSAQILLGGTTDVLPLVLDSTRLLAVRRTTLLPAGMEPSIRAAELDKLAAELDDAGGFATLLPLELALPEPSDPAMAPAKGILEAAILDNLATSLSAIPAGSVVDHALGIKFAEYLGTFVQKVALSEAATPLTVELPARGDEPARTLTLPRFKFDTALRSKAVKTVAPGRGVAVDFALAERLTQKAALTSKLNDALGTDIATADVSDMPTELRRWVLENQKVLKAFD